MIADPYPATVLPDALAWDSQYRIVPSRYLPVNFFEDLVDPELMEEVYYLEGLTNDRLRQEVGDISLVAADERVSGPGSTPVMAAFTHIGRESRFSDGRFGVYYASQALTTAIAETRYHREAFLRYTHEAPGDIEMRVHIGSVHQALHDIRSGAYAYLHEPDNWNPSQAFGAALRQDDSWGLVYRSVRDPGGECLAAFKPNTVSKPRQGPHLVYQWDGRAIAAVFEKTQLT
jgi:hypothetical protein